MADFVRFLKNDIVAPTRGLARDAGIMDLLKSSVGAGTSIFNSIGQIAGGFGRIGQSLGNSAFLIPLLIGVVAIGGGIYLLKNGGKL